MIVSLCSVRGAPGVTSWSLALAAAWPHPETERVVIEADLDGGVLGARYALGVDPGVVSFIAALRRNGADGPPVEDHARPVGSGVWLMPGPESAEQSRRVWAPTAGDVADALSVDQRTWFVDAGRVGPGDPTTPLLERSSIAVLLCRGYAEDLLQVPYRLEWLQSRTSTVGVVVAGTASYGVPELVEFFGTPNVWRVQASDDVAHLATAVLRPGRARRSWLWRSALDVASGVATLASAPVEPLRMAPR